MIDFVVMNSARHLCLDVNVQRGASFWSDHFMVRARLRFNFSRHWRRRVTPPTRQRPLAAYLLADESLRRQFSQEMAGTLAGLEQEDDGVNIDASRHSLRDRMISVAEKVLG